MRRFRDILKRLCAMTAVFATMAVVAGCIKDDTAGPSSDGAYTVVLTTRAEADIEHDAQYPGEDAYNENAINRVILFFYPDNPNDPKADDTPAIYSEVIEDVNTSHRVSLSIKADLREKLFGKIDGSARVFAVVNLPKSDKSGSASGAPSIAANATVNEIKSTVVETDFRVVGGTLPEFVMLGEGIITFSDNLKNASGTIYVTRTASKIRIALKITEPMDDYDPTDPDKVQRKWTAKPDDIRVYITNGVSKAHLGGAIFSRDEMSAGDYYKISPSPENNEEGDFNTRARTLEESGIEEYPYWNAVPLYSYPHSWENTPYEDRQTYLVIQVPWKSDTEGIEYTNCYYQVPINLRGGTASDSEDNTWEIDENTLESNMYYLVKLNIGMLGSFNPEEPLTVEASYYVVPWQEEVLDASLTDNRYLVVDQTNWVMNNEEDLDIPFHTSHKTMIARVKYRFWEFNAVNRDYTEFTDIPEDASAYSVNYDGKPLPRVFTWEDPRIPGADNSVIDDTESYNGEPIWETKIDNDNFIVSYHHDMYRWTEKTIKNENGQVLDVFGTVRKNGVDITGYYGQYNGETTYLEKSDMKNWSKIEIEITIIHEDKLDVIDDTRFMQTIYITQYPQMYIEAEQSNVDSNGVSHTGANGYLYVNGNRSATSTDHTWQHVSQNITAPDGTQGSSTNQNLSMYVVSISQLNDPDYVIGDPRLLTVNNNLSDGSFDTRPDDSDNPSDLWKEDKPTIYYQSDEDRYKGPRMWFSYKMVIDAPASDYNSSKLSNYYPTDESSLKENYVAPKLRIASSYGGIGGMFNKTMARRRCAAYQEAGRPAGRWRLPTKAEIKFINELSTNGCIPMLFSRWGAPAIYAGGIPSTHDDGSLYLNYPNYWCASGAVHINGDSGELEYLCDSDPTTRSAYEGVYNGWSYQYGRLEDRTGEGPNSAATRRLPAQLYPTEVYSAQVAVRCVYDEWYWVDADGNPDLCDLDKFTWGDKSKASPQD